MKPPATISELRKLLNLLRKNGVQSYEFGALKIKFQPAQQPLVIGSSVDHPYHVPADCGITTDGKPLTDEDILFLSAEG